MRHWPVRSWRTRRLVSSGPQKAWLRCTVGLTEHLFLSALTSINNYAEVKEHGRISALGSDAYDIMSIHTNLLKVTGILQVISPLPAQTFLHSFSSFRSKESCPSPLVVNASRNVPVRRAQAGGCTNGMMHTRMLQTCPHTGGAVLFPAVASRARDSFLPILVSVLPL